MKKVYDYYISYFAANENGNTVGAVVLCREKIRTKDDLENIRHFLEKEFHFNKVTILNIMKLKPTRRG